MGLDLTKLRESREAAELTQKDAAAKADMTPQAWNRIESGTSCNISLDTLDRISKALGVKAKDLLK